MTREEIERAMAKLPSLPAIRAEQERRNPEPFDPADMSDARARLLKRLQAIARKQQECGRVVSEGAVSLAEKCARTLWDPTISQEQSDRIWAQVRQLLRRANARGGTNG
jgi:hypothetical protein